MEVKTPNRENGHFSTCNEMKAEDDELSFTLQLL